MSTLFGNLKEKAAKAEAATDRLGGGFSAKETDIYVGTLSVAYTGQSSGGANFLQIIIKDVVNATTGVAAGEYREQVYFTSGKDKGQSPTYEKNGKEFFLPGYTVASDLLLMTASTELPDAVFEEKVLNIYDFDQQKELPKSVMVPVDAIGQPIAFALKNTTETKRKKVGTDYVDTDETRSVNNIEKIFHPELKLTVVEAEELVKRGVEPSEEHAVFWPAWLEANQGKVFDNTSKSGGNGKGGTPPVAGAQTGGGAAGAKKSLFGKK